MLMAALHARRPTVDIDLLAGYISPGSVVVRHTRCGKPGCRRLEQIVARMEQVSADAAEILLRPEPHP